MTKTMFPPLLFALLLGCGSTEKNNDSADPKVVESSTLSNQKADPEPLKIEVITSVEKAGAVNSTIISGATEAIVVDAQFTKSGAETLASAIDKSGKTLTTIFITHAHPDHFLGTAVLSKRFPDAKIVATADIVAELQNAMAPIATRMKGMLGPEFPGEPVLPTAISGDSISVDKQAIKLLPKLHGDTHAITGLYIESQGVLLASDVAYGDVHLWTASTDHKGREAWMQQTLELEKLPGLKRVIPGHQIPTTEQSAEILSYTRKYLEDFDKAAAQASSAAELIEAMKKEYTVAGEMFLQMGASAATGDSH